MLRTLNIWVLSVFALWARPASGKDEWSRKWEAAELFRAGTSLHMVLNSGAITLEKNMLVEDDAPGCGYSSNPGSIEILKEGVVLKKVLMLDRIPLQQGFVVAMLYPDYPPEPNNGRHVVFTVNGHDISWEVKHFWTHAPVPAEFLTRGANVILVRVLELDTRFKTWIALDENFKFGSTTRLHHLNRSARSTDGGKTWDDEHLGVNGTADGEYSIRLNLEAFQPEGWLESPVVDLAQNVNLDVILPPVTIDNVNLIIEKRVPDGTSLELEVRTGPTISAGDQSWSQWAPSTGKLSGREIRGRFLQYRLACKSMKAELSPEIAGAEIHSIYHLQPTGSLSEYSAVSTERFPVVCSSLPFEYENPAFKGLREFRARMKLDQVVSGARTEFEKMLRIKGWVARQWNWHLLKPEQDIIRWDANQIMTPDSNGKIDGGFCLDYAIVLMQALQSFGFPARIVSVDYSVWGGHEVVEAWSNQYGKWVYLDANFDTYFTDRDTGIPLNVLEMHNLFLKECFSADSIDRDAWSREDLVRRAHEHARSIPVMEVVGGNANSGKLTSYEWWNPPVELSAYCGGYGPLVMGDLRYMPRADYLSKPYPVPINHGRTHWGWTGYYCWYDSKTPRSLEHSIFTDRSSDLYWNLNQIDFRAFVVKSGVLRFTMNSNSPDLMNYQVTVNGKARLQKSVSFDVRLAKGPNRVEMRIIDSMGNTGSLSTFQCSYSPAEGHTK